MPRKTIEHPVLGTITNTGGSAAGNIRTWHTEPMQIGAFGYTVAIEAITSGGEPSEAQLEAMMGIARATPQFKAEVEGYLLSEYAEYIRPEYLATIGDPRYAGSKLNAGDLPEISEPSGIWQVIKGLLSVWVDEEKRLGLEFIPTFDDGHEFAVRFRDGKLYEVILDG